LDVAGRAHRGDLQSYKPKDIELRSGESIEWLT
jgi:hypothetical protein